MLKYRELFNLPDSVCYFNSAFISPQLKSLSDIGCEAMVRKEQPWKMQTSDFFTECDQLRKGVAELLNCSGENIALIPAVSYGVETAVKNLPLKPGQKVLVPSGDFPSNVYPWVEACKEQGARLEFVSKKPGGDWTTAFLEAMDASVAVVSVPQTDWSDGSHFDLKALSQKAKTVGAALVVDLSQSFGVVPVSVKDFDPDFVFSVGYKWQLGPYGVSYMYVADRHLQGRPLENNWLNRKTSEDFTRLTDYTHEYAVGARRFDSGQHSHFVLNPVAMKAVHLLRELGPGQIFSHIKSLNASLEIGLKELGFETIPENQRTGHMLGARPASGTCVKNLCETLRAENVMVSVRSDRLRISPHIYNSMNDVEHFLGVLKSVVARGVTLDS